VDIWKFWIPESRHCTLMRNEYLKTMMIHTKLLRRERVFHLYDSWNNYLKYIYNTGTTKKTSIKSRWISNTHFANISSRQYIYMIYIQILTNTRMHRSIQKTAYYILIIPKSKYEYTNSTTHTLNMLHHEWSALLEQHRNVRAQVCK
jgi:hypothetical protein